MFGTSEGKTETPKHVMCDSGVTFLTFLILLGFFNTDLKLCSIIINLSASSNYITKMSITTAE